MAAHLIKSAASEFLLKFNSLTLGFERLGDQITEEESYCDSNDLHVDWIGIRNRVCIFIRCLQVLGHLVIDDLVDKRIGEEVYGEVHDREKCAPHCDEGPVAVLLLPLKRIVFTPKTDDWICQNSADNKRDPKRFIRDVFLCRSAYFKETFWRRDWTGAKTLFIWGWMWGKNHCAIDRVMNRVVIREYGHPEDVHGGVCRKNKKDARTWFNFHDVIFCGNFDPLLVEHKPNSWMFCAAFRNNDTLLSLKFCARHFFHDLRDQGFVVEAWYHHCTGASVYHRVKAIASDSAILFGWFPAVSVVFWSVSNCHTLAEVGPEKIFLYELNSFRFRVATDVF